MDIHLKKTPRKLQTIHQATSSVAIEKEASKSMELVGEQGYQVRTSSINLEKFSQVQGCSEQPFVDDHFYFQLCLTKFQPA